jgi:hypothetical protein
MKINVIGEGISQDEINAYVDYGRKKYCGREITELTIRPDGEFADLEFKFAKQPFDRIRRITGYLVGTTERFNNAKRAEEGDRVKHSV